MEVQKIVACGFISIAPYARVCVHRDLVLYCKIDIKFAWQHVHARKVHTHSYPAASVSPAFNVFAAFLQQSDSFIPLPMQVLPNRTHPVLLMSGGGGYLLTGMTVATETDARPVKTATQAKDAEPEPASKRIRLEEVDAGTVNKSDAQ